MVLAHNLVFLVFGDNNMIIVTPYEFDLSSFTNVAVVFVHA